MRPADLFSRPSVRAVGLALAMAAAPAGLSAQTASLDAQPTAKEPIIVMLDRAKVMRISRPADTIIIGNPGIADATIQDNQTLIVTGRSFGSTNLIILDAEGQPIADEILMVQPSEDGVVTVFRRSARTTLSCAPVCGPTVTIGDSEAAFNGTIGQVQTHHGLTGLGN